jgi:hypothetical protein
VLSDLELRSILAEILAAEDASDWAKVASLSLALTRQGASQICPNRIYHFIDDFDIRQRDPAYARRQREEVRSYLSQP